MKTLIIIATLFVATSTFADRYTDQMTKNIGAIYKAKSNEEYMEAINLFERIGGAEKTKWEPFYYATFGYIMMSTSEKEGMKIDSYLDQAQKSLDKALAIKADESELAALQGFIHTMRASADPAARGQQYSMMAMQSYGKAIALNPNNPRALALMSQLQFGTARFFSQEPVEACESARKALELYNKPAVNNDPLAPAWGKGMTEGLVKNCK